VHAVAVAEPDLGQGAGIGGIVHHVTLGAKTNLSR
jgi:hypothetical protein